MQPANSAPVEIRNRILNPAEAEIWITFVAADPSAETELRGRLVGPHCPYTTTVEVAYPLRPLPGPRRSRDLRARVLIPEPSFWEPETPFLYQGSVEIWKAGSRGATVEVRHGLRTLQLGKSGMRFNARALTVRGVACQRLSADDALQLRREGFNTLLAPVSAETAELWDAADQFGFLVLGRLPVTPAAFACARSLTCHACCLGWLLSADALKEPALLGELVRLQNGSGQLLGVELDGPLSEELPQPVQFIFAKEDALPPEGAARRPVLLQSPPSDKAREGLASSGILGWVTG
jgi:hypothetical protein